MEEDQVLTALHSAVWKAQEEIVALLLEKGASVIVPLNTTIWSHFRVAAFWRHVEIARMLIKSSTDIDHKNNQGLTAPLGSRQR